MTKFIIFKIVRFIVTRITFNWFLYGVLCHILYWCLHEEDKKEVNHHDLSNYDGLITMLHFSYGRYLRNELLLWKEDTPIVRWFRCVYGLDHADDISGLVIIGVIFRNSDIDRARAIERSVKEYKEHWEHLNNIGN